MKYLLTLMLFSSCLTQKRFETKTKLECIDECFIYSNDSTQIICNYYCVQQDSETFYFGWDTALFFKNDSSYLNIFQKNKNTSGRKIMAILVDYKYQFLEIAECFEMFMKEESLDSVSAIKRICEFYEQSSAQDEFPWMTVLKYNLYYKSSYN